MGGRTRSRQLAQFGVVGGLAPTGGSFLFQRPRLKLLGGAIVHGCVLLGVRRVALGLKGYAPSLSPTLLEDQERPLITVIGAGSPVCHSAHQLSVGSVLELIRTRSYNIGFRAGRASEYVPGDAPYLGISTPPLASKSDATSPCPSAPRSLRFRPRLRQTEASTRMDMIPHAASSPGSTCGGGRALAGLRMTGFRPVAGFVNEGGENGSKLRRPIVTMHLDGSRKP